MNPKVKSIPDFNKTIRRKGDFLITGGNVYYDVDAKCNVIYDGAMEKCKLTQPKLDIGIPKLENMIVGTDKGRQ